MREYTENCPENTVFPNEHSWVLGRQTGNRWCAACGQLPPEPKRINEHEDLMTLYRDLGVRPDWHEPDEVNVTAKVIGTNFDNAGHWPADPGSNLASRWIGSDSLEMYVELHKDGLPVAQINLATLFSWATARGE